MTRTAAWRLRAALSGLAAGGLMLGHWAVYLLREPDAHARTRLLAETGHELLPQLVVLAAAALAVGLCVLPYGARATNTTAWRPLVRDLVALQCGGFLCLELAERLWVHAGGGLLHLLADPTIAAGVVLQVPIGAVAALLLALLLHLAPVRMPLAVAAVPLRPPAAGGAAPRLRTQRPGQEARSLRGPPLRSHP